MAFIVMSPAFDDGGWIPREFTCDGDDARPPLTVSDPPEGTRSYAVIVDDPDAPIGLFTHWLAYDIPAGGKVLQTSAAKSLRNDFGRKGYGGPCPPPGHGVHRYYFTVYAVDTAALDVPGELRGDLEIALGRHTLEKARLMGRYERKR